MQADTVFTFHIENAESPAWFRSIDNMCEKLRGVYNYTNILYHMKKVGICASALNGLHWKSCWSGVHRNTGNN